MTIRQPALTICGTLFTALLVFTADASAQTSSPATLHNFTGGSGGANPYAGVAIGSGGVLYGIAQLGGTSNFGTVFSLEQGTSGLSPSINAGGVVNAANYAAPVAPGSIASAFGDFLLSSPLTDTSLPLSTNLSGLSVQWASSCTSATVACPQLVFGGYTPLFFVSGGQVNLQVPWEAPVTAQGQQQWPTTLDAALNHQTGAPQTVTVAAFAPAIFSMNEQGTGQGAITDTSNELVDLSNPATPGLTYVQIFCTGLGSVTNQPPTGSPAPLTPLPYTKTTPTVTIGGVSANVSFSGLAPGYVGLYQVNTQVPAGLAANNAVPVVISIGGVTSNTVTIAVQ